MPELTLEEKATNYETYRHIENIRNLINMMVVELLHRGVIHDQSKLGDVERSTFVEYTPKLKHSTYGSDEYKGFLEQMKPALDHHYANNRHHPEHFDSGIEGMNLIDLLEMLIDWKAASLRHDDGDILVSIEKNIKRFSMSPQIVAILQNTVRDFGLQYWGKEPEDEQPEPDYSEERKNRRRAVRLEERERSRYDRDDG